MASFQFFFSLFWIEIQKRPFYALNYSMTLRRYIRYYLTPIRYSLYRIGYTRTGDFQLHNLTFFTFHIPLIKSKYVQPTEQATFGFNKRASFWTCMYILVIFRFQLSVHDLNHWNLNITKMYMSRTKSVY